MTPSERPDSHELHVHAVVSGHANAAIAGRDVHVHYGDHRRVDSPAADVACPYPGLAAFTADQDRWFFGREADTARLLARLEQGGPLVLVAPSGAGKSSLLRAGLLPAISRRGALPFAGSSSWPQLVFTPTARPVEALTRELANLLGTREPTEWADAPVVLVVDQFEELFTLCSDEAERSTFLDLLMRMSNGSALLIIGLRVDAYPACAASPQLREALQRGQVILGPLTEHALRQAVLLPAQDVGLDVEPGLADLLLRDLGADAPGSYEVGRLPLLAHALRAIWRERHGHLLTIEGYRTTGGISDAVATTAERVYTALHDENQSVARLLLLRLVKIGEDTDDVRRTVARQDLLRGNESNGPEVLDAFTAGRLLTQEQDTVSITHEVLLRAWPRLRGWIDEDREGNLVRQRLEEDATAWERSGRDTTLLYRGNRLEAVREITSGMTSPAEEFRATSIRQATRSRHRRRRLVALLSALTLVAGGAAGVALNQRNSARAALEQSIAGELTTKAQRLRGNPDDESGHELAAQLDLLAWQLRQKNPAADDSAAYTGLMIGGSMQLRPPDELFSNPMNQYMTVTFHPTRRLIALAVEDGATGDRTNGAVQLWDVEDPANPHPLSEPLRTSGDTTIATTTFSPNGDTLAVAYDDGTNRLWDVAAPARPIPLGTINDSAGQCPRYGRLDEPPMMMRCYYNDEVVAFIDDSTVAVGHMGTGADGPTTHLWDITNRVGPQRISAPLTHEGTPVGLIAADWRTRTVITSKPGEFVRGADFSTAPPAQVWNVSNTRQPTFLANLSASAPLAPGNVSFGANSAVAVLSTHHYVGRIGLWDLAAPADPVHRGDLMSTDGVLSAYGGLDYRADGRFLAVIHNTDYSIRLWDVTDPGRARQFGLPLTGHRTGINSIQYSPDSTLLVSAGTTSNLPLPGRSVVRLWDMDVDNNIRKICATTPQITREQWQEHVAELDYDPPCNRTN